MWFLLAWPNNRCRHQETRFRVKASHNLAQTLLCRYGGGPFTRHHGDSVHQAISQ